jgi:hypothetical protein
VENLQVVGLLFNRSSNWKSEIESLISNGWD